MYTFLCQVSQVDSLPEQITRNRSFRRSNSQALRKNTDKVSNPGAMPKEHIISQSLIKRRMLNRSLDFVDVPNLNLREASFSIIKILLQQFIIFRASIQTFKIAAQLLIILIMHSNILVPFLIQ